MSSFNAKIIGGKLDLGSEFNKSRFRQWLNDNENKMVRIEIPENKRTLSQNSYYWFYLSIVERETGNLASDLHEWCKRKFLPPKFIKINGEEIKIPGSTTELNKIEMGEFLEKISAWCEITLPDPTLLDGYIQG